MTSSFPILPDDHAQVIAHSHEAFASHVVLEDPLERMVKGEIRFDDASRALDATGAFNYRQAPIGLVISPVVIPCEERGWAGWKDSAVPPARIGACLGNLVGLIDRYRYRTPMYRHFGQVCVHLRFTFNSKTIEGVAKYRKFIDEPADIVLTDIRSLTSLRSEFCYRRYWLRQTIPFLSVMVLAAASRSNKICHGILSILPRFLQVIAE